MKKTWIRRIIAVFVVGWGFLLSSCAAGGSEPEPNIVERRDAVNRYCDTIDPATGERVIDEECAAGYS